ncbi:MAG: hypothetical protein QW279_03695 [Candidatus Jordarchaeaceae archaeon]
MVMAFVLYTTPVERDITITHGIGLFSSESVRNHPEIQKLDRSYEP